MGWAWVDHDGGRFDSGGAAKGTNQIAELTAVLRAIEAHPGEAPLLIESDSKYAISCATDWVEGWRRKGWRTASGSPVKNLELVQAIDRAITQRPGSVRFRWVRGHVGNPFNERADSLAVMAAKEWQAGRGEVRDALLELPDAVKVVSGPAVAAARLRLEEALAALDAARETLIQAEAAVERATADVEAAEAAEATESAARPTGRRSSSSRPAAGTPATDPAWETGSLFD